MRRTVNGFVRETIQGLNSQIDLPFLTSSLPMDEIYEGIEFTPECVQEAEETYSP
jgi:hypothetical protein